MNPPEMTTLLDGSRQVQAPVFDAPWEAQAFGLALMLHRDGLFTWAEWADRLAAEIAGARSTADPDDGSRYYEHWLAALEKLIVEKKLLSTTELSARKDAWDCAARSTPHGAPIELRRGS